MNAPDARPSFRLACRVLLALAAWHAAAAVALAQSAPRIERVRIGLPFGRGGSEGGLSRNGSWAPVYVTLKAGSKGVTDLPDRKKASKKDRANAFQVAVRTSDIEETPYRSVAPVPG